MWAQKILLSLPNRKYTLLLLRFGFLQAALFRRNSTPLSRFPSSFWIAVRSNCIRTPCFLSFWADFRAPTLFPLMKTAFCNIEYSCRNCRIQTPSAQCLRFLCNPLHVRFRRSMLLLLLRPSRCKACRLCCRRIPECSRLPSPLSACCFCHTYKTWPLCSFLRCELFIV